MASYSTLDRRSTDLVGGELLTRLGLLAANAAIWGHVLALPVKLLA